MKKSSRVLYTRDAWHTLQAMLLLWSRDCVASITTSPGLGDYSYGDGKQTGLAGTFASHGYDDTDVDSSLWPDGLAASNFFTGEPNTPLTNNLVGTVTISADPILGQWTLVTLENAARWLTSEFEIVARRVRIKRDKATIPGKAGRFRTWLHWSRCEARALFYIRMGIARLQMFCLTQSKRLRGPQRVQTRRTITADYYVPFRFNGTHAMRLPHGRPALSEAEWLKRHNARNAKRRKTNRRNSKGRTLKIHKPKHGRPLHQHWQELLSVKPIERRNGPQFSPDSELDVEAIISEIIGE